jgi:hypothetical protein
MDIQVQEVYSTPNCQKKKRNTAIIIKTLNIQNKERIVKAAKEKRLVTYKGKLIRTAIDFSTQTPNARRSGKDIFQALKENNCQPYLVHPAKLYFLIEGELKTFHNKQKTKGIHDHQTTIAENTKRNLHTEEEITANRKMQ